MAYSPNLGKKIHNTSVPSFSESGTNVIYGRVLDIVLDQNHPDFRLFGGIAALGGVRFKDISSETSTDTPGTSPFAFCGNMSLKTLPLIDEIVEITAQPIDSIDADKKMNRFYYTDVVNLHNSQYSNAFPNYNRTGEEARLGLTVEERSDIRNSALYPGDVLLEGRLGSSLRMTGILSPDNPLTDEGNNGKPLITIRNTENFDDDVTSVNKEDINLDDASIYLTTDHSVPIEVVSTNNQSFTSGEYSPESENQFRGRQIVIDSGRILLHGKDDSVIIKSRESVQLSSNSVNIDSNEYTAITGNKIYLGDQAYEEEEPVVLGTQNEERLYHLSYHQLNPKRLSLIDALLNYPTI